MVVQTYGTFDYEKYLRTKNIYGLAYVEGKIEISKEDNLNTAFILSNKLKNKIENNLDEILKENSEIAKRNFASEIQKKYQKKQ